MDRLLFCAVSASGLLYAARRRNTRSLSTLTPPYAKRKPHVVYFGNGYTRTPTEKIINPPLSKVDDLFWLRDDDRKSEAVLAHLRAENEYTEAKTAHLTHVDSSGKPSAVDRLYQEFLSRIKETDTGVPYYRNGFWYFTRTIEKQAYPIYKRIKHDDMVTELKRLRSDAPDGSLSSSPAQRAEQLRALLSAIDVGELSTERVVLDVNKVAAGNKMCDVADWEFSDDDKYLCYAVDFSGSEKYTLVVREQPSVSGETRIVDEIQLTSGSFCWGQGSDVLYYTTLDDQHRPNKLWRHKVGTAATEDECLYTEDDERFWLGFHKSLTDDYIIVESSSQVTSEAYMLPLNVAAARAIGPDAAVGQLCIVAPRIPDMLYDVEVYKSGEHSMLVVRTNKDGAKNFKLMQVPLSSLQKGVDAWVEIIPHDPQRLISGFQCFANFWSIAGRSDGYSNLWVLRRDDIAKLAHTSMPLHTLPRLPPRHDVYVVSHAGGNYEYNAEYLRFAYGSPLSPTATCEVLANGSLTWDVDVNVLKQKQVPNFDPSKYRTKRIFATANDGTRVPVSVIYPASLAAETGGSDSCPLKEPSKLHIYGYGSYGHSLDMHFSATRLSFCDRGIVYAVAHVRGGSEMGRTWYEDEGKKMKKWNTFNDFIAVADHLVKSGWTRPKHISAEGASAGGLLMGVVLNTRPDLWGAILSDVGFVDVMTTMSDETIPLTVTEYDEWGNPHEREAHEYMKSYSPVDNVKPQAYPKVLLTAGLHDSRVGYWEAAKFAQRLRAVNTSSEDILLKVEMEGGHFSYMDRYAELKESAFNYAWVMDALGVKV